MRGYITLDGFADGPTMKNPAKAIVICSLLVVVASGCARTPNVEIGYYLPKSVLSLEVTRVVTCDNDKNPIVASTFVPTVSHTADRSAFRSITLDELDGLLSNSSLTFEFYEDGRLKGINTTSAGRGREFIKSAASLAASLGTLSTEGDIALPGEVGQLTPQSTGQEAPENGKSPNAKLCDHIERTVKGKNKELTLQFGGVVELERCRGGAFPLAAKHQSKVHVDYLGSEGVDLGRITMHATPIGHGGFVRAAIGKDTEPDVALVMREPAAVEIAVTIDGGVFEATQDFWSGTVLMAQCGPEYRIPMPKAALFGEQTFELAVTNSGAVTKLSYTKETGAAEVVGIGQDVLDALGPIAAANAQTAAMKAEADRIAAQQRLVRCRADPENCK